MVGGNPHLAETRFRDGRGEWGIAASFSRDGGKMEVTAYPIGTIKYCIDVIEMSIPLGYESSPKMKRFLGRLLDPAAKIKLLASESQANGMIANFIPVLNDIDKNHRYVIM